MKRSNQLLCAHSGLLFCLVMGSAFILAGWLPPPSPDLPVEATAELFRPDHLAMRIAVSILAMGAPLFLMFSVAIFAQQRRIEGPEHILSYVQVLGGAIGVLALQFPAYFWLGISFRPDTPADVIAVFNNISFFLGLAAVSPLMMQTLSIGLCILGADSDHDSYPRWVGFASLWLTLGLLPGVIVPFFPQGPFSYSGVIGFWMVVIDVFVWLLMMYWQTLKAIQRQTMQSDKTARTAAQKK